MSVYPRQGPVLDYASPRPRGKVRLPSRSRIELKRSEREVIVREWLAAKAEAFFALGVAGLTLITLPAACLSIYLNRPRYGPWEGDVLIDCSIVAVIWICEIILMLFVINNTWRQTILQASREGLVLQTTSPFGKRQFEWDASQIEQIRSESTSKPTDLNHLAELELHVSGEPVARLFTDQPADEINAIASALGAAIGISGS